MAGHLAGGDDEVATVHALVLENAVEEEQILGALAVPDGSDRARLMVLRRDGALLVGQERDEGRVV
jgi:hypothetical protein